jgi:hypothetical protein
VAKECLGKLQARTSSEPASQSDDVDRQSELPDISPPAAHGHGWSFVEDAETTSQGPVNQMETRPKASGGRGSQYCPSRTEETIPSKVASTRDRVSP